VLTDWRTWSPLYAFTSFTLCIYVSLCISVFIINNTNGQTVAAQINLPGSGSKGVTCTYITFGGTVVSSVIHPLEEQKEFLSLGTTHGRQIEDMIDLNGKLM
jgi:hypothetical protein